MREIDSSLRQALEQLNITHSNGHYYQRGYRDFGIRGPSVSREYVRQKAVALGTELAGKVEQYYNAIGRQKAEARQNEPQYCDILAQYYNSRNPQAITREQAKAALDSLGIRVSKKGRNFYEKRGGRNVSVMRDYVLEKLQSHYATQAQITGAAAARASRHEAQPQQARYPIEMPGATARPATLSALQPQALQRTASHHPLAQRMAATERAQEPLEEIVADEGRKTTILSQIRGSRAMRRVCASVLGVFMAATLATCSKQPDNAMTTEPPAAEARQAGVEQARRGYERFAPPQIISRNLQTPALQGRIAQTERTPQWSEKAAQAGSAEKPQEENKESPAEGRKPAEQIQELKPQEVPPEKEPEGAKYGGFTEKKQNELYGGFIAIEEEDKSPEPKRNWLMRALAAVGNDLNDWRKNSAGIREDKYIDDQSVHRSAKQNLTDLAGRPKRIWEGLCQIVSTKTADNEKKGIWDYPADFAKGAIGVPAHAAGGFTDFVLAGYNLIVPDYKPVQAVADVPRTLAHTIRRVTGTTPTGDGAFGEVFEPSVLSEAAERTKVLGIPLKAQDPDTSYDVNGDGKATAADYITGSIPVLSRFKQKHGQQLKVPFSQKLGELAGYLWPFAPGKHGGGGGAAAEAPGGIPRGHTRTGGSTRSGGST